MMLKQEKLLKKLRSVDTWGVLAVGADEVFRQLATLEKSTIQLRIIEGGGDGTHDSFMEALRHPLKLPSYFGKNWSALDDSLHDMEWLQADAYIFVIADADEALTDHPEDLEALLGIMREVHLDWKDPKRDGFVDNWTNTSKEMYFILQVTDDKRQSMTERLEYLDIELPIVNLNDLLPSED